MKDLIEYLVTSLCDKPEKVEIRESEEGEIVTYFIKTDPTDIGKIIGKQGKIIRALRTLVKTRAIIDNKKVQLQIEESTVN